MILYLVKGYLDLAATTLADAQALLTALANPALAANQATIDRITGKLETLVQSDSGEPLTISSIDDTSGTYSAWVTDAQTTLAVGLGLPNTSTLDTYASTTSFSITGNTRTGTLALNSRDLSNGLLRGGLRLQIRTTNSAGAAETRGLLRIAVVPGVLESPVGDRDVDYTSYVEVAALATAAAASATAAATAETHAETAETNAETAETAAAISAAAALVSENAASASASTATTQAGIATTQAGTATTQAGIATTQAGLATTAKTAAETAETNAETAETNAETAEAAAAVSAAAALVSEAAALVSKNAAAASAATASAVSGSGNGTFSAAALTGVNSVTASTSTALTLTGGSSGASLVLGHTAGASMSSTSKLNLSNTTSASSSTVGALTIGNGTAATNVAIGGGNVNAGGTITAGIAGGANSYLNLNGGTTETWANFQNTAVTSGRQFWRVGLATSTGGTGTVANSFMIQRLADAGASITDVPLAITPGTVAIGSAYNLVINGTTASTSTTTGALTVAGGVGVSGAGYFGGTVNAPTLTDGYITMSAAQINRAASFVELQYGKTAFGEGVKIFGNTANVITFSEARILLSSSPAANAVGTGGLQSPNFGISTISGGASYFGGNVNAGGTLTVGGVSGLGIASNVGIGLTQGGDPGTFSFTQPNAWIGGRFGPERAATTGNAFAVNAQIRLSSGTQTRGATFMADAPNGTVTNHTYFFANGAADRLVPTGTYSFYADSSAGAAYIGNTTPSTGVGTGALQVAGGIYAGAASVFGGAVTVAGTVIHTLSATPASASATGTVGTMSWDANYVYICTATNTWKRVAIATW